MRSIELKKLITIFILIFSGHHSFSQTGTLDSTFNGNGQLIVDNGYNHMTCFLVQPDSSILVAGGQYDIAMARYKVNGSPDSSFGNNGVVVRNFSTIYYSESTEIIELLPNGKILLLCKLGGHSNYADTSFYFMAKFLPNGNIDSSFGQHGIADLNFSKGRKIDAMSIQRNGKIVLSGSNDGTDGMFRGFIIARLNRDGSYDNSFGTRGLVHTIFTHQESDTVNSSIYTDVHEIRGMVIQDDGKIIAAGYTVTLWNDYRYDTIAIARYNTDGSLDSSYDGDGKIFINPPNNYQDYDYGSSITAVLLQPDQKLLIAGNFSSLQSHGRWLHGDLALIRLNTNGKPDSSFDGDGMKDYRAQYSKHSCVGIALQSDNKILLGGNGSDPDGHNSNIEMFRVHNNGDEDNDFGPGGFIRPLLLDQYDIIRSYTWVMKIKGNRIYMLSDMGLRALKNNGIDLNPATRKLCQSDANLAIKAGLTATSVLAI